VLIINADDWGRSRAATDSILACLTRGRITSVSAMVFMPDSERAADLATAYGADSGLHLNFTEAFDGSMVSPGLAAAQRRIAAFLRRRRWSPALYNPLLAPLFRDVYRAQCDEYVRLYRKPPSHMDGHHHMHLCTNVLLGGLLPRGTKVRRNFSFRRREKTAVNRLYRRLVDTWLLRRYICTDVFASLAPVLPDRLSTLFGLARSRHVELMVHPERSEELAFLLGDHYAQMLSGVERRGYAELRRGLAHGRAHAA
jgi:predicted glycoside hydrolase/deacetylase ChbG (UPF0249 family)